MKRESGTERPSKLEVLQTVLEPCLQTNAAYLPLPGPGVPSLPLGLLPTRQFLGAIFFLRKKCPHVDNSV